LGSAWFGRNTLELPGDVAQKRQGRRRPAKTVSRSTKKPRPPSRRLSDAPPLTPRTVRKTPSDARGDRRDPTRDPAPRPFLKWAGGKRQLLTEIALRLPGKFGTYYEPFVGGGALFFHLLPARAVLADQNERLIRTYSGIKNNVDEVIDRLKAHKNRKTVYLRLRKLPIDGGGDAEIAAWFIFLNKTGFNGLYRVNSRNEFNVPYGDNKNSQVCDDDNLRACSKALEHTVLLHEDFATVVKHAKAKDLVYFDPPYVPLSETSYFTSYTAAGFRSHDQTRLRDVALRLKKRGVSVLLSNSSAAEVSKLYAPPDFECIPVAASRLVNSKASGRGKIAEMLIR
jgi:DNA adenine methylase